ncbi:GntR family transcriptional regulator [Xylanibacillus composti]|uniref:GntR family transcriptional regulator n=1 Tax=Xylanibacillus composti TaxID=1572762 RepID=A0A8J4M2W1_9BACL|nr:GntR family transcriptional regulator [Xylanibacillus composti]MDT9726527.1 GntR family transcriptional regulator [Xylanibacillus composti]GIQ68946.1 GntR family transcriptional regulator [Xylanibacillus composti]
MKESIINKTGPEPIYVQVQNWMRGNISSGIWKANEKIPSESDLADKLQISRGSLKQAIKQLVDEGVLLQIHGKGTFVKGKQLESPVAERLISTAESLLESGNEFTTHVVSVERVAASQVVAEVLNMQEGNQVYRLQRIRYLEEIPVMYLENYLSCERFPDLDRVDFESETLFSIMEQQYNSKIHWGKRSFVAEGATKSKAELLQIEKGTPIILLEQVTYSDQSEPLEYSKVWIRSDQMKLTSILRRT